MSGPTGALPVLRCRESPLGSALRGKRGLRRCVLLLCLSVRGENGPGFVTTWISFVLLASLFIGLLAGGSNTVFLVTNVVLFLGVGIYVVPQPGA